MSLIESLARPWREPDQPERQLRVVPARAEAPARAPFVLLVVAILGVGLVGLLLLNTSLQRGSFAIHDLKRQTSMLAEREEDLDQRVARLKAPENLAGRAQRMGMVPNANPVFLRLSDGAVLGEAVPAEARVKPRPKPKPSSTPAGATAGSPARPTATPGQTPVQTPQVSPTPPTPGGNT
ncbi:hypothetical protein ABN034_02070 [Actinopolymorpha sp. B11F2]|uniref:hypothetical protein n=1 Tax=Actinopolymorpha sp. B11F2 TaxID=3160862 RepID=UPI0032E49276